MTGRVLANRTCVAVRGRAVLIEGAPGSGKSSLALALVDRGATLVGDDAVAIRRSGQHLVASPPAEIAGKLEVRGVGIVEVPTCSAPVSLILVLGASAPRFPEQLVQREIDGVAIPELPFVPGDAVQARRAELALEVHGLTFDD